MHSYSVVASAIGTPIKTEDSLSVAKLLHMELFGLGETEYKLTELDGTHFVRPAESEGRDKEGVYVWSGSFGRTFHICLYTKKELDEPALRKALNKYAVNVRLIGDIQ